MGDFNTYDVGGQGYYNAGYYDDINNGVHTEEYYSDRNEYGATYGEDPSYYPQDYEYQQEFGDYSVQVKEGSFYLHSEMVPFAQTAAVSSLAFDDSFQGLYTASTTQNVSSTRWNSHKASMLVTHNTTDGMLYSSVAGHPEASPSTLQTIYEGIFGIPRTISLPRQKIPPHAYRAPFGGSNVSGNTSHIGITTILPLNGYAATVSPAAVRIHVQGGLQLHDYDIEGMLSATIHPRSDQGAPPTHISVGGFPSCNPVTKQHSREQEIHCMDLWQGLRIVSSRSFKDRYEKRVGVTVLATSHERGSIVAGCSDGYLRLLDGSLREVATVKCHKGGVSSMSISPDGVLIATTGYSSRVKDKDSGILYAFPDPTVYIYDIRRLGQAGIPHPFAGARASPHHVAFLPDLTGLASNRLLVGSGQSGGGLQVMVPFETHIDKSTSFLIPPLEQGESISAMAQSEGDLALGTSQGRVLTYKYAGYKATKTKKGKEPLVMPPFVPPAPPLSIDPKLLLTGRDPGIRPGIDERMRALVSTYILRSDPKLSSIGNSPEDALPLFGPIGASKIIPSSRRTVSASFIGDTKPAPGDFIITIPTSKLEIDLLADHNPISKRYKGKKARDPKPNPNKLLYNLKLSSLCYDDGGKCKYKGQRSNYMSGESPYELPPRYRLQMRAQFRSSGAFDPCDYNETGLFPGWDYAPTMPNSFASPVLMMLYFMPELLSAVLDAQYNENLFSSRAYEKALAPELGFLFHQIESLSSNGLLHPTKSGSDPSCSRIGAWTPCNFLTALSTIPEAEQLQILDGSPAAVDSPRRPEAFYRFLAYQLDKELSKNSEKKLLDSLHGIDFVCSNQFITGSSPPSHSSTRAMTLDLSYDLFFKEETKNSIPFGELLHHSLCRETRLRAWNSKSKAYETIVQRKIATSLPQVLTISCACAGRKEEDGLWVWRVDDGEPWLPEVVEIELQDDGSHIVKQLRIDESGEEMWLAFQGRSKLPAAVSTLVSEVSIKQKRRYRLDAVLSFINDSVDSSADDKITGHHVLHTRIPFGYKKRKLEEQKKKVSEILAKEHDPKMLVLTAGITPDIYQGRLDQADQLLGACDESNESSWALFNGFAVSNTVVDDARAFHVLFKEPCMLTYRAVDDDDQMTTEQVDILPHVRIPSQVMSARSLATVSSKPIVQFNVENIYKGKLVAFDAEFVSVQEEETTLLESGSKVILRETRHAVGRISVIDCTTRKVIVDDHVLPRERVIDYLTRFSGIVPEDLDPNQTTHNLISTRSAYLKLRFLMEQGCIFVGHGLRQDFATVNLIVPPCQILDTVEIYHQPGMRYISLRFLANYVLRRDMQQDVHDSVEDALAAFELYEKALEWKDAGVFDQRLQEIYSHGQTTDWKLGMN